MKKKKSFFKISPFTFLFALIWFVMGNGVMFIVYILALVLHECAHSFVAHKLGYRMDKITISPLGATLYADADEFTSKDEFKIALAGPMFSAICALVCVALWWIEPELYNYTMDFCMANFSICIFNFLPIFPLDGGRVLSSFLSRQLPRNKVASITMYISLIFSCCLILLSIISIAFTFNYTFAVIGVFIIFSLFTGKKENSYMKIMTLCVKSKKLIRGLDVREIMVSEKLPLAKIYSLLDVSGYYFIHVVDDNFKEQFVIDEKGFFELLKTFPASREIGSIHIDKNDICC